MSTRFLTSADALPYRPRRVAVAGVSGSGKTTVAARLSGPLGLRHTEIDGLFHGPGWTRRDSFVDAVLAVIDTDDWVIEWQYAATRALITERADLLVWLDLPYWTVSLPQVVRRTIHRRLHREQLWNGNREPPLRTILTDREQIIRWSIGTRHKTAALIRQAAPGRPELPIVRLRSRAQIEQWVRAL